MLERSNYSYRVEDLVGLVNAAALRFLPLTDESDGRLKGGFTARTLRHYQTLGCLDSPELVGRVAIYGYRHYLQALLIRKLLFESFSSQQIKDFTANRTTEGLLELLMRNVEVEETPVRYSHENQDLAGHVFAAEQWTELKLSSEITLKIRGPHSSITHRQHKELLKQALAAIQSQLG